MLNRIVWNRTVYLYKNGFGKGWYAIKPNQTVIYRNPFWFTNTFQTNSQPKTVNNK